MNTDADHTCKFDGREGPCDCWYCHDWSVNEPMTPKGLRALKNVGVEKGRAYIGGSFEKIVLWKIQLLEDAWNVAVPLDGPLIIGVNTDEEHRRRFGCKPSAPFEDRERMMHTIARGVTCRPTSIIKQTRSVLKELLHWKITHYVYCSYGTPAASDKRFIRELQKHRIEVRNFCIPKGGIL